MMRKEVPTWVAVVVILVVLIVVVGAYIALTRPKPIEPAPIEMGGHAGPMKMKEMGGEQAPAPQPPR